MNLKDLVHAEMSLQVPRTWRLQSYSKNNAKHLILTRYTQNVTKTLTPLYTVIVFNMLGI